MAVPLTDAGIKDLISGTLANMKKRKLQQIATQYQRHEVMKHIMRDDRVEIEDGHSIERTLMKDDSGAARMAGLYEVRSYNVGDVLTKINVPWRQSTTYYAWERHELLSNRGDAQIVKLVDVRRADGMLSLARLMEGQFWSKPTNSNDLLNLWGVTYWLVPNSSTGFNGGNPSGFTSVAGVDPTTVTTWKNYTGQYTTVSDADLIDSMRTAYRKIDWETPIDMDDLKFGRGDDMRVYMNEATLKAFEREARNMNDNLGFDFGAGSNPTFNKHPMIWVPYLDSDTTNPVYMINWSYFRPVVRQGEYLRETDARQLPYQPNVFVVDVDLQWNVLCVNRRAQAVFTL